MANALDMLGRAILRIGGMSPQQIRQQVRANKPPKPMPTSRGSKPSSPKPPAPGSIKPKGQTNAFARNGSVRDFRNPKVAANRAPTLTPVPQRGGQATPPNRPPGGFGQSPGQGSFNFKQGSEITRSPGGAGASTRQPASRGGALATQGRGPLGGQRSLPPGRPGGPVERAGPTIDVEARPVSDSRGGGGRGGSSRALPQGQGRPVSAGSRPSAATARPTAGTARPTAGAARPTAGAARGAARGLGRAAGAALLIPAIIDQVREVVQGTEGNQEWARRSASLRNQPTRPQQGNHQSRFAGARDANLNRINNDPRFAAPARQVPVTPDSRRDPEFRSSGGWVGDPNAGRQVPVTPDSRRDPEFRSSGDWVGDPNAGRPQPTRSPAIGAPVHARPAAFGAAQGGLGGSADAPGSVYTPQVPQRPSTPAQAVQSNPYAGIGDVRGQELPQTNIQQDAQPSAGTQEYGGQKLQGIDQNGVDMERRRAFLDANNSLDGMTAVRELLKRRKLSISVSD